eukprot:712627-Pleurochrysis_carterae.AAC.1
MKGSERRGRGTVGSPCSSCLSVGAGVGDAAATSLRREGGRCERPSTETGTTTGEPGEISNKAGRIST